jgi:hypothetical protein
MIGGTSGSHYNGAVRGRLAAGLIALVILVTGVIPAVAGYRCIATGARMQTPSPCCHQDDAAPALKAQCCQAVAAAQLEPRSTPPSTGSVLPAPTVVAWIVFPPTPPVLSSVDLMTPARARGRPPGERLHLLSPILRV